MEINLNSVILTLGDFIGKFLICLVKNEKDLDSVYDMVGVRSTIMAKFVKK